MGGQNSLIYFTPSLAHSLDQFTNMSARQVLCPFYRHVSLSRTPSELYIILVPIAIYQQHPPPFMSDPNITTSSCYKDKLRHINNFKSLFEQARQQLISQTVRSYIERKDF